MLLNFNVLEERSLKTQRAERLFSSVLGQSGYEDGPFLSLGHASQ